LLEFNLLKLKHKNNNVTVNSHNYSFDTVNRQIVASATTNQYTGRQNSLNILPRLLYKASRQNSFETHLQAYITQNYDNQPLSSLLIPQQGLNCWIGNEVACGVGMQRIDLMLKQETDTDVFIRLMELKDESPYQNIVIQIKWYLEWISDYVIPKYQGKNIHIIPTIIAKGNLSNNEDYTHSDFVWMKTIITSAKKQKNNYCYTQTKNKKILKQCNLQNSYTIIPKTTIKDRPFVNIKNNIDKGALIMLEGNKELENELENIINYIISKGYKIQSLEKVLKE